MEFNFENYNPRNFFVFWEKILEKKNLIFLVFSAVFLCGAMFYFSFVYPPAGFPVGVVVRVSEGETLKDIANDLETRKIIRSKFWFEMAVVALGGENRAISGDYFFEERKNSFSVAYRIVKGDYGLTPIRITLQEGLTAKQMANVLEKKFSEFDSREFLRLIERDKKEGYLFPDTYLFLPNIRAVDVERAMLSNFNKKIDSIKDGVEKSGKSLEEIVVMASILEEEGRTFETRKIISGILWNRMKIGMPLQVDAVFPYIIGKNTYQLTLDDLKVDSEYNTYTHKGLPPGAISNPGLNAIIAAFQPIETDYLYYLSDRSGNMHYATDFEQHKLNKVLYLN